MSTDTRIQALEAQVRTLRGIASFVCCSILILQMTGCTIPALNFTLQNVSVSKNKINAQLKSVSVSLAHPNEQTGRLPAGMELIVPQLWSTSLKEAIARKAMFQDDAKRTISIFVKILRLDVPDFGLAMTAKLSALYEIIDVADGDVLFSKEINSTSEVPFGHDFAGFVRLREAINRATRHNIITFLQSLENVEWGAPRKESVFTIPS